MAQVSGGYAGPGLGTQGVVLVDGGRGEGARTESQKGLSEALGSSSSGQRVESRSREMMVCRSKLMMVKEWARVTLAGR